VYIDALSFLIACTSNFTILYCILCVHSDVIFLLEHIYLSAEGMKKEFDMAWQDDYKPARWLPLLQAAVAGARNKEESEAAISLQLLATVAEVGEDDVAPHVPDITAAVQEEICQHIPPHPEPWPMVI
jgi:hypothetical protein